MMKLIYYGILVFLIMWVIQTGFYYFEIPCPIWVGALIAGFSAIIANFIMPIDRAVK